ncbi:MAG: putative porin [Methylotenera sp.]|nr:putative porin [Methylotenera sp.]
MNFKASSKLHSLVAATLTGSIMMGFGANAIADSTFDLVQALVQKGVLTEEEAIPLLKGRENDIQLADKKVKKAARLSVSDAIDNATVYGDIRVRAEYRDGSGQVLAAPLPTPATKSIDQERTRDRYKITFGVKTTAGDFYSDLAFAMGNNGRSDNATFGQVSGSTNNGLNAKETLFVKRAMLGWNATDWLTLEAGRLANPLYTTSMVWDGDLTVEGLAEKANFTVGTTDIFLNAFQAQYEGDRRKNDGVINAAGAGSTSNELLAFQGGAKFKFTDSVSAKAALTYYTYTNDNILGTGGAGAFTPAAGKANSLGTNPLSVNDLQIIEIPGEINFKLGGLDAKVFGDYAYNIDGDDRYKAALNHLGNSVATNNAIRNAGNDDKAWLLGFGIAQKQDKKPKQGDWAANVWYQDVGVYALDPNTPDSDFFDSRVNMKGIVFKGEYNLRDNVFVNFAAGHATRKNDDISAVGSGNDLTLNLESYNLYQLDLTYKF